MTNVDYKKIKLLVLDVDGVMTDGRIILSSSGEELKCFNCKDGAGLKYWQRAGGRMAWITGRQSPLIDRRAEELGVGVVHQNCKVKLPVFERVLSDMGLAADQAAVVGDDLPDLPMMRACGFSAAPADAVEEIRRHANYVCKTPGGGGCVREVVELILQATGAWKHILTRYLPDAEGNHTDEA